MTPTSKSASPTSTASPSVPEAVTPRRVWWLAARPATLAASVSPVLAGTAIAVQDGRVRTLPALGALVVAVAMQIGVNYANDYADFVRGADTPRRFFVPNERPANFTASQAPVGGQNRCRGLRGGQRRCSDFAHHLLD